MRPVTSKLRSVLNWVKSVSTWLENKKYGITSKVNKIHGPYFGFRVVMVILGVLGLAISLAIAAALDVNPFFEPFPIWGWITLTTSSVALSGVWGINISISQRTKNLREMKRGMLEAQLKTGPLFQRAELIVEAVEEYRRHVDHYHNWWNRVAVEETEPPDEEKAERYWNFLEQARAGLVGIIKNFNRAVDISNSIDKGEKKDVVKTKSLVLLLDELNTPLELPPEHEDPEDALESEEQLASALQEIDLGGENLAAELDALESSKDSPEPPVST